MSTKEEKVIQSQEIRPSIEPGGTVDSEHYPVQV